MALSRPRAYSTPRGTFSTPPQQPQTDPIGPGSNSLNTGVGGAEHIQVLFAHSNSRIVNFTFSTTTFTEQPLPWKSPTERTIASGPLRIYKTIPHNVAFLQSGSALRPLLSKTQCWNVDGRKIFCLQLRPGNYWRIEIIGLGPEQEIKCVEFRDALAKIIAFEVTACPFVRDVDCIPLTESPDVLLPARVWKRPPLLRVGQSASPGRVDEVPGDFEQNDSAEKDKHALSPSILLKGSPKFNTASSPAHSGNKEERTQYFNQRLAKYESDANQQPIFPPGISEQPLRKLSNSHNSRCQLQRPVKDAESKLCMSSEEGNQALPEKRWKFIRSNLLLGDYGLKPDHDNDQRIETHQTTVPGSPLVAYSSIVPAVPIKPPVATDPDHFSTLPEYPSSLESREWQEFTPPHSPLSARFNVTPPFVAPPVLNDSTALGVSSSPSTPVRPPLATNWHTPAQKQSRPNIHTRRRGQTCSAVDLSHVSAEPFQISPTMSTPPLSSGSESESDNFNEIRTPPRPRPSTHPIVDSHISRPQLRRVASSLVLSKTVNIAAATANFVVLKPSAFLVAMMFSIAARIAARAVAGAAYSFSERGDPGWDDEFGVDDYGFSPPNVEKRRRRSEICDGKAWGLEE